MTLPTVSTVPSAKAALVGLLTVELAPVQCGFAWPGKNTEPLSVFLGQHPDMVTNLLGSRSTISSPIASLTTGRQRRNETYPITVTMYSFRADLTVEDAAAAEADGFVLLAGLENVLADNKTLGLDTIEWAQLAQVDVIGEGPIPFLTGWASVLVASVEVKARLT